MALSCGWFRAMPKLGQWALVALVVHSAIMSLPVSATPVASDSNSAPAVVANCTFIYECQAYDNPIPNIHCAVCKNETACEQCAPGYALHKPSGACLSCVAHCLDECTADSDPVECSACEDGYVLAVYKNWEDPPLGSQWSEESRGCFIPRTYCFSCLDGNCAPGHCEPAEGDTQSEFVGGGFPGGCTECPSDSVPIPAPCAPDDDRCFGPEPYMCTLPEGSCTNCTRYCLNTSQPFCSQCPEGYGMMHDAAGVGNTCTLCGPHCSDCEPDQPANCTHCYYGFNAINESCIADTVGCPENCTQCTNTGFCEKCKDGLVFGQPGGHCMEPRNCSVANCSECMFDMIAPGQDACDRCKPGLYRTDPASDSTKCASCLQEGCSVCELISGQEPGSNCSACLPGYYAVENGRDNLGTRFVTCVKCPVPGCEDCETFDKSCIRCAEGFLMDEITNKCVAEADKIPCEQRKCGQCSYLYFPSDDCAECDKDKGTCHRPASAPPQCPEHCTECEGDVCTACEEGWHLDEVPRFGSSRCEKPCMKNCPEVHCVDYPLTGGTRCSECYSGYRWDDVQLACVPHV